MLGEFTIRQVCVDVIEHLERRRPAIVADEAQIRSEVKNALVPVRKAYADCELPRSYLDALEEELTASLPQRWRNTAVPYTELERRGFGLWRGGDVVARLAYVSVGLVAGGLIVAAPFIPIWEKWFPFALAFAAWWFPDLQMRWLRRRYSKALGEIISSYDSAQKALDRHITVQELLPPSGGTT